jgi:hypothetical protein
MLLTSILTKTNNSFNLFYFSKFKLKSQYQLGFCKSKGIDRLTGTKVLKTKGRNKYKNVYRIFNKSFLGFLTTSVLLGYYKLPQKKTPVLISLFFNSVGGWFINVLTTNMFFSCYAKIFSIQLKNYKSFLNTTKLFSHIIRLGGGEFYAIISLIGSITNKSIKWAKSPGSRGVLFVPIFFVKWAVVLLPSKAYKIFNNNSYYAHLGIPQLALDASIRTKNAGFNINRGIKPTVRGTVKNPNDHPNGGRSRALRLSRTPWGFPTKKTRKT